MTPRRRAYRCLFAASRRSKNAGVATIGGQSAPQLVEYSRWHVIPSTTPPWSRGTFASTWSMVSSSWSQRWQLSWASSPCHLRLSAVHRRRLNASHKKILILSGAQDF
jgi:hypothetical protein